MPTFNLPLFCDGIDVSQSSNSIPSYVSSGAMPCLKQPDMVLQDQSDIFDLPNLFPTRSISTFSDDTNPHSLSDLLMPDVMPCTTYHPSLISQRPFIFDSFCECFAANYNQNSFFDRHKN